MSKDGKTGKAAEPAKADAKGAADKKGEEAARSKSAKKK